MVSIEKFREFVPGNWFYQHQKKKFMQEKWNNFFDFGFAFGIILCTLWNTVNISIKNYYYYHCCYYCQTFMASNRIIDFTKPASTNPLTMIIGYLCSVAHTHTRIKLRIQHLLRCYIIRMKRWLLLKPTIVIVIK